MTVGEDMQQKSWAGTGTCDGHVQDSVLVLIALHPVPSPHPRSVLFSIYFNIFCYIFILGFCYSEIAEIHFSTEFVYFVSNILHFNKYRVMLREDSTTKYHRKIHVHITFIVPSTQNIVDLVAKVISCC